VATVREYGVLQPVLVAPAAKGRFRLIAGEGRYRAAIEAGDEEIPARVRAVDEETGGVELALIENLVRERLDPVDEARGYQALIDRGLSVRGIAQRLPKIPQKRISERLAILKLPAELQAQIADGTIPLQAVRALTALARIDPELPALAAGKVLAGPHEQWDEPTTWADLTDDPITVVSADYQDEADGLPAGVFESAAIRSGGSRSPRRRPVISPSSLSCWTSSLTRSPCGSITTWSSRRSRSRARSESAASWSESAPSSDSAAPRGAPPPCRWAAAASGGRRAATRAGAARNARRRRRQVSPGSATAPTRPRRRPRWARSSPTSGCPP
jgi:ParB/RepB/Spo0J family partition protein